MWRNGKNGRTPSCFQWWWARLFKPIFPLKTTGKKTWMKNCCNCFGVLQTTPIQDGELSSVCSDCSMDLPMFHGWSLSLSWSLPGLLYSLRHNDTEIGQLITKQWPLSFQVKRRVTILFTLNYELETIKLNEESMSKDKISRKLDLMPQTVTLWINANKKFSKETKSATPVNMWMIKKTQQLYCWHWESLSSLDRRSN